VLPQALAMVVPGIMNNFIGTVQGHLAGHHRQPVRVDRRAGLALNSDANWRPFKIEGYLFIALIYFVFCFSMSRYSHLGRKAGQQEQALA
jgi:general L-amino acid transport system permease protein